MYTDQLVLDMAYQVWRKQALAYFCSLHGLRKSDVGNACSMVPAIEQMDRALLQFIDAARKMHRL